MTALGRVSLRMARSLDPNEVLGEITRGLVSDLDAALARIWLVRAEDPGHLHLVASAGLSERLDGSRQRVAIGELKIGEIAEKRTPVNSTDLASDPRFVDKTWIEANGLTSFAGYPLLYGEELLGVLAMFARRPLGTLELEQLGMFAAQASVAIKNASLFAEVRSLTRRLEAENAYLEEEMRRARGPTGIIGTSPAIERVLSELERVAPMNSTVLLQGETGTGKELFAQALHEMSPRKKGPLVKVNCAALSPALIESELFGHEKGAFTGAAARKLGRFEIASGGTLFLDEVSELPEAAQAKLLRVLQEHEVDRVGGTRPIPIDVRIVAATNRDLAADVRANRFRSDLFFRLNVFPISLPSLRDRREDIPLLAKTFLEPFGKTIDKDALGYLQAHEWPGNVRELHNVLERASILARGEIIQMEDLPDLAPPIAAGSDDVTGSLKERVNAYERSLIADALRRANDNQSEAARLLEMSRATLQYRMKILGV